MFVVLALGDMWPAMWPYSPDPNELWSAPPVTHKAEQPTARLGLAACLLRINLGTDVFCMNAGLEYAEQKVLQLAVSLHMWLQYHVVVSRQPIPT